MTCGLVAAVAAAMPSVPVALATVATMLVAAFTMAPPRPTTLAVAVSLGGKVRACALPDIVHLGPVKTPTSFLRWNCMCCSLCIYQSVHVFCGDMRNEERVSHVAGTYQSVLIPCDMVP